MEFGFNNGKTITKLIGGNYPYYPADVEYINGKRKMLTDATVTVEQVFGQDPFPDTYFTITNAGATNDTLRVQIAATIYDPSSPDSDYPAVDVTTTVTASEAGNEIALAEKVVTTLNADSNFTQSLKAKLVPQNSIVHIFSRYRGERYERSAAGSFVVSTTGSVVATAGFDNLISRGKATSLSVDPNFPHKLGVLAISGTVNVLPGSIGKRYEEFFKYSGSRDMRVNGSVTPIDFTVPTSATDDIFISQVRIFGGGNGIKFGSFLNISALTNGLHVHIKSDNETLDREPVKKTEDFKNYFSFPTTTGFKVDVQSGSDQLIAIWQPEVPFPIRKQGTFGAGNDDYISIEIHDNLSSGLSQLEALALGFRAEA